MDSGYSRCLLAMQERCHVRRGLFDMEFIAPRRAGFMTKHAVPQKMTATLVWTQAQRGLLSASGAGSRSRTFTRPSAKGART
jgi:hypothetical protein